MTYDSETGDTPVTDYTEQVTGGNIVRWVDKAEPVHNYNLKSSGKTKIAAFNAYVYSGTYKQSRLYSSYITEYGSNYIAGFARSNAAVIEYKNDELKDVYFDITYGANEESDYYSATVIATGYTGPFTVGSDSTTYQYLGLDRVNSSDYFYDTDTGANGYSYRSWNVRYPGYAKTYYIKKTAGDIRYWLDGNSLSKIDSVIAYYNDDPEKNQHTDAGADGRRAQ